MGKFLNPKAGFATLREIHDRMKELRAAFGDMNSPINRVRVCKVAALVAPSYIDSNPDDSLVYYMEKGFDADAALEAMAWQTLFGSNGSDAQVAAARAMEWAPEYGTE
ncbi:MAG TPA: hypothetical protein VIY48_14240 [Candidatus Paceibacterota bacterium]